MALFPLFWITLVTFWFRTETMTDKLTLGTGKTPKIRELTVHYVISFLISAYLSTFLLDFRWLLPGRFLLSIILSGNRFLSKFEALKRYFGTFNSDLNADRGKMISGRAETRGIDQILRVWTRVWLSFGEI